jgi:hypothetical protein
MCNITANSCALAVHKIIHYSTFMLNVMFLDHHESPNQMINVPGTSSKTNPNAMKTVFCNTLFTNVAATSDGGVFWEGLEDELPPGVTVTDWLGKPWTGSTPAAHPNSRYVATSCATLIEQT